MARKKKYLSPVPTQEKRSQEAQVEQICERKTPKRKAVLTGEALEVLDYWNSKGIIKHKPDNQELVRNLPNFLLRYDIEDVKTSIDNYATVFFDTEYKPFPGYKPYKWTLAGFLAFDKQICHFMPDGQKWLNYCRYKEQTEQVKKPEKPEEPQPQQKEFGAVQTSATSDIDSLYRICVNTLKIMPYRDYIQTEHWQHFRREAYKHFNGTCQLCGVKDETLHVHHKTYVNRGRETFNDVILLCQHCHDLYHHNQDKCTCPRCAGEEGEHELDLSLQGAVQ